MAKTRNSVTKYCDKLQLIASEYMNSDFEYQSVHSRFKNAILEQYDADNPIFKRIKNIEPCISTYYYNLNSLQKKSLQTSGGGTKTISVIEIELRREANSYAQQIISDLIRDNCLPKAKNKRERIWRAFLELVSAVRGK
jgi:hypothetical protein